MNAIDVKLKGNGCFHLSHTSVIHAGGVVISIYLLVTIRYTRSRDLTSEHTRKQK